VDSLVQLVLRHSAGTAFSLPPVLAASPYGPLLKRAVTSDPGDRYPSIDAALSELDAIDIKSPMLVELEAKLRAEWERIKAARAAQPDKPPVPPGLMTAETSPQSIAPSVRTPVDNRDRTDPVPELRRAEEVDTDPSRRPSVVDKVPKVAAPPPAFARSFWVAAGLAVVLAAVIVTSLWPGSTPPGEEPDAGTPLGALPPPSGRLVIVDLMPESVEVYLDGVALGRAPGDFAGIDLGPHVVVLRATGYLDLTEHIQLSAGTPVLELRGRSLTPANQAFPIDTVSIPGGHFWQGCEDSVDLGCRSDERPGHSVALRRFEIDRSEVTVSAYGACVSAGVCSAPETRGQGRDAPECNWGLAGREQHPINCVSWYQAQIYCEWVRMRLPTESEWELAARGMDRRLYPWGNEAVSCNRAIYSDPRAGCRETTTQPVGQRADGASPWGVMDLAGNVEEWTADRYDADYYAVASEENPMGPPDGEERVVRGGGFDDGSEDLRASRREGELPWEQDDDLGFRCARSVLGD
jgi:iron(II)-dependent oxidoreductase